jgi:predicted RNase H-like HicB family nuclease
MKTTRDYRGYIFRATCQAKYPADAVDFPVIPDIITSGGTLAEAFANACQALDLHLESLQKLGVHLPEPRYRLLVQEIR